MSTLLDSSVVVDILRALPAALEYARSLGEPPICSEISRVEVLRGVRSGERAFTERVFASFQWVGLDGAIAKRAGEIGRSYRQSHAGIGLADLVIAATAQELGLELATGNVKHFPMFKGLRAPYEA
jgi:predicted nucleic acid-binding protein